MTINYIVRSLTNYNGLNLTIFLFIDISLDIWATTLNLNAAVNYIISTKKFEESVFSISQFLQYC